MIRSKVRSLKYSGDSRRNRDALDKVIVGIFDTWEYDIMFIISP